MTLSIKNYDVAFIHLNGHAFFKALLFISVGSLISAGGGFQDLRMFGVIFLSSPYIKMVVNVRSLRLCGFFFLCGFYTKDLCLERIFFTRLLNNVSFYMIYFYLVTFSLSNGFLIDFLNERFRMFFFILMFYVGIALTVSYTARFFYYTNLLYISKFSLKNKHLSKSVIISTFYLLSLRVLGGRVLF